MSKTLFILNDPSYGTERGYNGLRLAGSLAKRDGEQVRVFLVGDAANCAKVGQPLPNGYYRADASRGLEAWWRDRRLRHLHGRPWTCCR